MHSTLQWLFVGTQRSAPGSGITRCLFDADTGSLTAPELAVAAPDPSFFVVSGDRRHLYACHSGTPGGVGAYRLDAPTGSLQALAHHVSQGRGPSQLSLDRSGRFVLAANYGGGYLEVLALTPEGAFGPQTAFVEHTGSSVHPERQTRPYVHCVLSDPTNRYILAADLGTDEVVVYAFDDTSGLVASRETLRVHPGSGPRHLAWHPNGRFLYLIEELSNEVTVIEWDARAGHLFSRQTISTLPDQYDRDNTAAEVLVHPNGRYLYASNRGHDTIMTCRIANDGRLTVQERVSSGGRTPRYLAFDGTGQWLVAANCDSDSLAVFNIDARTGLLTGPLSILSISRPYGLAFVSRA
jgi:6-phosphogluconolactonase